MQSERPCPQCGRLIPFGQDACPSCQPPAGWWLERESLVLASLVVLIALFVVTGFVRKFYFAKEKALAKDWYGRGMAALQAKQPQVAVEDFRTALVYSGENDQYQLELAQALTTANHPDAAQSYLDALWEREPGSGVVNLALARLYANKSDVAGATRYYHNAIYGVWDNPQEQRPAVRFELCEFLLKWNRKAQTDSELIALAAALPEDAARYIRVGNLFLEIQDYPNALTQFRHVLRLDDKNAAAWAGAGEASFQMGNYREALQYFERATRQGAKNPDLVKNLAISRLVLEDDPYEPRLSEEERARRVIQAFNLALARLQGCAQHLGLALQTAAPSSPEDLQTDYANAMKMQAQMQALKQKQELRHHPERLAALMDLVEQIESAAEKRCGPGEAQDQALLLMKRQQTTDRP